MALAPARRRSAPAAPRCRPRQAFKDGNKAYKEENFKKAIENYERAVEHDPNFAEAWFYLGSSHQAHVPAGQGHAREQGAPRGGDRGLQEVAGDQPGRRPRTRRR